jgi:trimethylamine--corrinoid protein Co-methyltransferase
VVESASPMPSIKDLVDKGPIASGSAKRSGGREGRRQMRAAPAACFPVLESKIPVYEIVPAEAIELIHLESCKILEEIGIEFRDDEAAGMWKSAGADVRGYRVRIDRAQLMELVGRVPPEYTMHARNPERTVTIGGRKSIFVPMYGAPYVLDFEGKRRYGAKADLYNFHKLAYMSPQLHSTSSIICEPMDAPLPDLHLHIIYGCLSWSDKPFKGIVTAPTRAEDTLKMAGIVVGEEFVKENTVLTAVVN